MGIKNTVFNITQFGADDSGATLSSKAIEAAFEAAEKVGGGTVYVPAGTYLSGPIKLRSNTNLHLDAGSVIKFSNDVADYPVLRQRWEGAETTVYAPLLYGEELENVSVTGYGLLDGQGEFWWESHHNRTLEHARPRMIGLVRCNNVVLDGIRLQNSPAWTVNPILCENMTINNIKINNPTHSPNTDGINPDSCKNVRISNCHIDVGDDCIAIKSGTEKGELRVPCENITITNCTMAHGHGGVVIGSEMSGDVRNIVISNCVFVGTDRGIRIKSRRGRGGVVEDIQISNLNMQEVMCPIVLNLFYGCGAWGDKNVEDRNTQPVDEGTPTFRRMKFSNIIARNAQAAATFVHGLPEMPISDITFDNISISMAPDPKPARPAMMGGLPDMKKQGVLCTHVRDIRFINVKVEDYEGEEFAIENGEDIMFSGSGTLK